MQWIINYAWVATYVAGNFFLKYKKALSKLYLKYVSCDQEIKTKCFYEILTKVRLTFIKNNEKNLLFLFIFGEKKEIIILFLVKLPALMSL